MAAMLVGAGSDSRMAKALERHLRRGFAARGYTAACFDAAATALERISDLRELEEPLAVVVADESCPGMGGLDLLREARRLHPEVRTILLCDHADLATATDAVNVGLLDHFLIKPFEGERDLLPIVSDLLESWEGARVRDAAGVRIVGERHSPRAHEIRRFLDRNGVHHTWMSPTSDAGAALLREVPEPERRNPPVAVFPDGVAISDPTNLQLASELGLATEPALDHYELAIVGGGPAGLAAAVYGSSEGLTTVLLEREAPGGQAGQNSPIENYLGFHAGLTGAELSRRAIIQARRFGAEIVRPTEVVGIEPLPSEQLIVKFADGSTITSNGVVISTGASYRRLTSPGVPALSGRGIHYGSSAPHPQEHVGAAGEASRRSNRGRRRLHLHRGCAAHRVLPRSPPRRRARVSADRPGPGPAPRGVAAAAGSLPAGVSGPQRHRRRGRAPRIDQASRLRGRRGIDGGAADAPVPQDSRLIRLPRRRRRSATHRYAFDVPRP